MHERKLEIVLPKKVIKIILTEEQEREKNKMK